MGDYPTEDNNFNQVKAKLSAGLTSDQPNELESLTGEQRETKELVLNLRKRLSTVSNQEPTDEASPSEYPHISSNVQAQREINSQIRYILRTLVI